jgi:hypothetical protein
VGVLQRFERRLEGLVGNAFARLFKGQVEPIEVAKALQREAEEKRAIVGNGRVLIPNRYDVELGGSDHARLAPWEAQLTQTLAEMVQEHVDDEGWSTFGDIEVSLSRADDLPTGVFRINSRVDPDAGPRCRPVYRADQPGGSPPAGPAGPGMAPAAAPGFAEPGAAQQYGDHGQADNGYGAYPPQPTYSPPAGPLPPGQGRHWLLVDGSDRRVALRAGSNIIGRGQDADLRLADTGVSRRHVEIHFDGQTATLRDLDSTNGTIVNGHQVQSWQLADGDVIRIGHSVLVYRQGPA